MSDGDDTLDSRFRVGRTIQDRCRPCGSVRRHTVTAFDPVKGIARVLCETCGSQHNFRGGERTAARSATPAVRAPRSRPSDAPSDVVSDRELATRAASGRPAASEPDSTLPGGGDAPMDTTLSPADLERLLRRVIREESGVTPLAPAERWRGGELVLRPGRSDLQEKSIPIESFFNKIVMIRNRLRTMEQQINASDLPPDVKLKLQSYVTGCYGSLTTFNVLFAEDDDRFKGSSKA